MPKHPDAEMKIPPLPHGPRRGAARSKAAGNRLSSNLTTTFDPVADGEAFAGMDLDASRRKLVP